VELEKTAGFSNGQMKMVSLRILTIAGEITKHSNPLLLLRDRLLKFKQLLQTIKMN